MGRLWADHLLESADFVPWRFVVKRSFSVACQNARKPRSAIDKLIVLRKSWLHCAES
jgi:hypothetical protein